MKLVVIILMIFMITSINNVSGEIHEGEISSYVYSGYSHGHGAVHYGGDFETDGFYVMDGIEAKDLISIHSTIATTYWIGSSNSYGKSDVNYKYNGAIVGTGYMYFWQQNTDSNPGYDYVYIKAYIDNGLIGVPSGKHTIEIDGSVTSSIKFSAKAQQTLSSLSHENKYAHFLMGYVHDPSVVFPYVGTCTTNSLSTFYNSYNWWYNENDNLLEFNITRDAGNKSRMIFSNDNTELINETTLQSSNHYVVSDDIDNSSWYCTFIDSNDVTHEKTFDFIPVDEDTTPTLTTDKIYYNNSETITINTTNLQTIIDTQGNYNFQVYFLYEVDEVYNDYRTKGFYNIPYYMDNGYKVDDDSYTIDTSFLVPEQKYQMGLVDYNDYFGLASDIILLSDYFYVIPDNEFITTSCTKSGSCNTAVGLPLSIFYNINNNSNIIIKDNDDTTINTIYNVIGNGSIIYNIPIDENRLYSYPDWTIYLNNTAYDTSFNTDVEIFWSNVIQPTPTPYYPPDEPDENVTNITNELKEEVKPILDLIYGLSEIVVDNPDYDNDNVITEFEMNHWFNSLIPGCIVLFLVIIYLGLKKR